MDSSNLTNYNNLLKGDSSQHAPKLSSSSSRSSSSSSDSSEINQQQQQQQFVRNYGLTTREALLRLHSDMEHEVSRMRDEFSKRKFISWLKESVSFESELSKMRWPSVLFMTAQAIAHFIVAFILNVENPATDWVGFQGIILTMLLIFNLAVNLWDTKLRFKELLMKSEQILRLIKQCSHDKQLLKQWRQHNWTSARAETLFVPKSPCVHQTLTYRDESCLNLPDYLLVKGDIIHLNPGERAPGGCMSLKTLSDSEENAATASDKILLREGQIFIGAQSGCEEANVHCNSPANDSNLADRDMIQFRHAKLKKADSGLDFLMLSTPYIKSLRMSLRSHKRPVNSVEKECFIISRKYFETFVIPSVFLLSTIVTAIHYGYLDLTDSDQKIKTISIAYLLLRPSLTIMPFLPWMFPCFWLAVNAYGSARLICCGEAQRGKATKLGDDNHGFSPEWSQKYPENVNNPIVPSKFENLLATPTAAGSSENKHDEDDLHDLRSDIKFTAIFAVFIDLVRGKSGHVWRSSSLLQVLGCLTSLCCIDKVGILSWSNPIPEKVFVLTKTQDEESRYIVPQHNQSDEADSQNQADESGNQQTMMTTNSDVSDNGLKSAMKIFHDDPTSNERPIIEAVKHSYGSQSRPEVLDVSQSINCFRGSNIEAMLLQHQSRLQFDDLNWRKYISNLKPLGLGILMNNCCEHSFGDYFRFYKHISYQSILRCNTTPVMKRRCICALSKLIGFSRDAVENYKYLNQIGIYQLIDASSNKPGKLVPSLENTTRLKLPFPNMICNIYQDVTTGSYQAFSHGTADIVLDSCVEFWDGKQLVPLEEMTKKKIMDFYHRTSLTSYCSAFSYTPLLKQHKLGNHYIELPPQNSKFSPLFRKLNNNHQEIFLQNQIINLPEESTTKIYLTPGSHISSQDNIHNISDTSISTAQDRMNNQVSSKRPNTITRRHLSVGDLLGIESENSQKCSGQFREGSSKMRKLTETLDEVSDQVFVGMVALQYQACPDFVALVEQLEHACIRFVHFSKENELRSRVFSEKMGLESGWNCHISLQSDQDLNKIEKGNDYRANTKLDNEYHEEAAKSIAFLPTNRVKNILGGFSDKLQLNKKSDEGSSISSDERTLYSWKSLPSLVMKLTAKLSVADHHHLSTPDHNSGGKACKNSYPLDYSCDNLSPESDFGDEAAEHNEGSIKDEGFESLAFDMSNRAKLPKGIENIRPHLETVDNVPLQVSLFTDCTPELTQEMIEIMQEYGEIVCVIGSSSSCLNTPLFLQANASIAIEPLVPLSCTREDSNAQRSMDRKSRKIKRHEGKLARKSKKKGRDEESEFTAINMNPRPNNPRDRLGIGPSEPNKLVRAKPQRQASLSSSSSSSSSPSPSSSSCPSSSPKFGREFDDINNLDEDSSENDQEDSGSLLEELPGPSSLASKLASLPCSYSYNRKDPVNLYSLIMEARHFTFKMKNTFVCMICFALSISSAQFLASILFLPPMLSSGLTIWLTVVVVPLMSFSLMSITIDSQVMKIAVGKNLQLKPENITFFVICYLIKFIPSIIVVVLSFGLIIAHSCKSTGFGSSSLGPCWMFTYVQHGNNATSSDTGDEDLVWSTHLLTAQVCAAFLLVVYFVVISAGFVHRSHLMWQRSPTKNRFWVLISLALIFGQLVYNHLVLHVNLSSSRISYEFLASLPLHIWIISFISPVLVTGINLLVKRAEIKATIRQQRRARFDFNTKLGMNSPF